MHELSNFLQLDASVKKIQIVMKERKEGEDNDIEEIMKSNSSFCTRELELTIMLDSELS